MRRPDMARIGPSHSTKPELFVRSIFPQVFGPVFNDRAVPGCPDVTVITRRWQVAVFADGRFWHDPRYARLRSRPHHRTNFHAKAKANRRRDRRVTAELLALGFTVIRVYDDAIARRPGYVRSMIEALCLVSALRGPAAYRISKHGLRRVDPK